MKYYNVSVSKTILAEIEEISDFIISISTPEHAIRYKNQLISEIETLSYLERNVISLKIKNGTSSSILMAMTLLLIN
jgi:hypothetical protein